jgi:hypothetical protein
LQLQRKKREEIMVTEETMKTMGEEVEINLDRTQNLWATWTRTTNRSLQRKLGGRGLRIRTTSGSV